MSGQRSIVVLPSSLAPPQPGLPCIRTPITMVQYNYYCSRLFSKIESANHIIFLPHPRVQQILTAHESAMLILHPTVKEVHLRWKSNPYMVPPDELKRGTERQQNVL